MPNPRPNSPQRQVTVTAAVMAAGTLLAVATLTGCASQDRETFVRELRLSTQSLHDADVATAREHLDAADEHANTEHEQRQARSLDALIRAAEQLMQGDTAAATRALNDIEDPNLRAEVAQKARRIDLHIPLRSAKTGDTP